MGPRQFWIENRKLENQKNKLKSLMIIGLQKNKNLDRGVGWWGELYPNFFWISKFFFNFARPLNNPENTE